MPRREAGNAVFKEDMAEIPLSFVKSAGFGSTLKIFDHNMKIIKSLRLEKINLNTEMVTFREEKNEKL